MLSQASLPVAACLLPSFGSQPLNAVNQGHGRQRGAPATCCSYLCSRGCLHAPWSSPACCAGGRFGSKMRQMLISGFRSSTQSAAPLSSPPLLTLPSLARPLYPPPSSQRRTLLLVAPGASPAPSVFLKYWGNLPNMERKSQPPPGLFIQGGDDKLPRSPSGYGTVTVLPPGKRFVRRGGEVTARHR